MQRTIEIKQNTAIELLGKSKIRIHHFEDLIKGRRVETIEIILKL